MLKCHFTTRCIFLLLVACLFGCVNANIQCPQTEKEILLHFKKAFPHFNSSLNWTEDGDCCKWKGVFCNSSRHVNSLFLVNYGLKSQLPAVLSCLYLEHLNLSGNHFYGAIPLEFSSFRQLRSLDISDNNLSGNISILDSLTSLNFLNISKNNFTGGLPEYKNLKNLEEFHASENKLGGRFTTSLCQFAPKLTVLDFSSNRFHGYLKAGLSHCVRLQELYLGSNNLSGSIPSDIYNLSSLSVLSLINNHFNSGFDDNVGNLQNLKMLLLCTNQFSGALPKHLSRNHKLTFLSLAGNNFSGSLHLDFANLTSLEVLDLNSNSLSGMIPGSVANCTELQMLVLSKNHFTGRIPNQLNALKKLTGALLSSNQLQGDLLSLVDCENLVILVLTKNYFKEPLPEMVNGFRNLQVLALGYLNLSGQIPGWLQSCTKLQILDLSWNHFYGRIPEWMGNFPHLTYLELSNNSLTGTIPPKLFNLVSMMHSDNSTAGLRNIDNALDVKRQSFSLGLTYNKALPTSLYLSNNNLSGAIPVEIGKLKSLVYLDLSHNQLSGRIPVSLADLVGLEQLDLSNNSLTGNIPETLCQLTFLATFNVSYNLLSGPIPRSNQFASFTNSSYEGNPGLCGAPILRPCQNTTAASYSKLNDTPHSSFGARQIILVSISVAIGISVILVFGLVCVFSRKNAVYQASESSGDINMPESLSQVHSISIELFHNAQKLTVGDLFKSTNNFDNANIIGCGGFGLVYRADLADGTRLAIKKLTGDCGQMEREFRAEVDVLSKAQHKNLVSLKGYLQVGNQKLLIYSYMENGSLDYWLHERLDGGICLDWPTRLKIAQGAAGGLAYLHQACIPHIVHRDIKSSNILLDEQFEAHLADFGLARLLLPSNTHVTTELVGTLGYIPPEYGEASNATTKGDIYSFGVVLLELLTGKRPVDVCKPKGCGELVGWVQQMKQDCKYDQIFDNVLSNKMFEEQMKQLLDVACLCINRNPLKRPVIKDVVKWLNQIN